MTAAHQNLYQINTRLYLSDLSRSLGRSASLRDVPGEDLDWLAALGFDWVWMLGVWQTGAEGRRLAREDKGVRAALEAALPDLTDADVVSSPFAVQEYRVHEDYGDDDALQALREELASRGMRLMLDFVPNHVARDHPWVKDHPEYFVAGSETDLADQPGDFWQAGEGTVLAHGRDPNFPGWTDTVQLDYGSGPARQAVIDALVSVAARCDGVRCDMAMLVLNDVFAKTWPGRPVPAEEFWSVAVDRVRRDRRDFVFMAEAYWGLESALTAQGFDFTYDKTLYDGLTGMDGPSVSRHLRSNADMQHRSVHFIENHDEPRAAAAFVPDYLRAAAVLTALAPGIFLVHEGQMRGWRTKAPMQLGRREAEPTDSLLRPFYERLLAVTRRREVRAGSWEMLEIRPAWEGNPTWERFVAFRWGGAEGHELLVTVNLGSTQGQCLVPLPASVYADAHWSLRDLLGPEMFERNGDEMSERGLYLDMLSWGVHALVVTRID